MLAIKTVGKPFVGFLAGLSLGALSILGMNDIVYSHFIEKLYGPVKIEVKQGVSTSQDFSRITKIAAQSSKDFVQSVKPFGITKVNVKKLFIEDEDYSTPEDHYFSFLRRRKEQEMIERGETMGPEDYFEEPKWKDTHEKEDYLKLGQSTLKQVFGKPLGLNTVKQNTKIDIDEEQKDFIRANPQFARDSQDFDSRNEFGFFKVTEAKEQPLQKSPERLKRKVTQTKGQESNIPQFNYQDISNYLKNPQQIKNQIKQLERRLNRKKVIGNRDEEEPKPSQNLMLSSIRAVLSQDQSTSQEFKVVNQGMGIASLDSADKQRLHKLATKARYQ